MQVSRNQELAQVPGHLHDTRRPTAEIRWNGNVRKRALKVCGVSSQIRRPREAERALGGAGHVAVSHETICGGGWFNLKSAILNFKVRW
jgi:hypothetical protein